MSLIEIVAILGHGFRAHSFGSKIFPPARSASLPRARALQIGLFTLFVGLGLFVGARRQQLAVLASGSLDLVRTYASKEIEVQQYASGRAGGGLSYQQQEHQRFLEDPLDDGDGQTFSL